MIFLYAYVLICGLVGLIYSTIGPNLTYLTSINEILGRVYMQSPYSLSYTFMVLIFGLIVGLIGYFCKNPRLRKNLLLISAFTILGFFALYFGFIIGLFKEYTFDNIGDYRTIGY